MPKDENLAHNINVRVTDVEMKLINKAVKLGAAEAGTRSISAWVRKKLRAAALEDLK